ncbi:hypothetical protein MMC13_007476 [Lambiella insularis]|nr:hypothetical protein [Lambiella insularis]
MPPETSALEELVADYHELNSEFVDEIYEQPSALEFMRYVAKNRPFIVRGGALHWPAIQKWNFDYLITVMKNQLVNVAVTPHGNADSVVANPDNGLKYFVKPHEISEPFSDFLRYVQLQELNCDMLSHVKYAQTQNDNLRGEYALLFEDVDADIVWSHVALGQKPEAINLWIGNSRSTTALHRDNYENIYCQVIGHKHFVLVPPVEIASVGEESLRAATYTVSA